MVQSHPYKHTDSRKVSEHPPQKPGSGSVYTAFLTSLADFRVIVHQCRSYHSARIINPIPSPGITHNFLYNAISIPALRHHLVSEVRRDCVDGATPLITHRTGLLFLVVHKIESNTPVAELSHLFKCHRQQRMGILHIQLSAISAQSPAIFSNVTDNIP